MKIGVYSCMTPDLTAEELCRILHEIGCPFVEWTVGYRWHLALNADAAEIRRYQSLCKEYAINIVGLGSVVSLHDGDLIPQVLRQAASLGAPQVRLVTAGYNGKKPYNVLLDEARRALAEVEKHSRQIGVKALLEIHMGTILPSASAAYRVVESFDPACIGLIFDPGNMLHEGFENWQMGLEILGPYLAHVHIKNYGWFQDEQGAWKIQPTALDDGIADYEQIIAALRHAGYEKYLCLEDFRGGYGGVPVGITSEEKLHEDYAFMARLLNQ